MWTVAILGFLSKILFSHRVEAVSVWTYLLLGWMPVVAARSLTGVVPLATLWWMLAGGLCYTIGTVFLANDARFRHFHTIWHLSVIAGSTCHFCAIYFIA